ncbi:MAG TPA: hypothetical protein VHC71_15405 [Hyphomicrobium sp.]|jgi:hypothetical protein|nr:hypothetical protein [Hyphomicrobium sp.]
MPDVHLDTVRREFAHLTGLFEDAALLASKGQGIDTVRDGLRQMRRVSITMGRIQRQLVILNKLL